MASNPDSIWELRFRSWLYSCCDGQRFTFYYKDAGLLMDVVLGAGSPGYFLHQAMNEVFDNDSRRLFVIYETADTCCGAEDVSGPRLAGDMYAFLEKAFEHARRVIESEFGKDYEIHSILLDGELEGHVEGAWGLGINVCSTVDKAPRRKFFHYYTLVEGSGDPDCQDACQHTEIVYAETLKDILEDLNNS